MYARIPKIWADTWPCECLSTCCSEFIVVFVSSVDSGVKYRGVEMSQERKWRKSLKYRRRISGH